MKSNEDNLKVLKVLKVDVALLLLQLPLLFLRVGSHSHVIHSPPTIELPAEKPLEPFFIFFLLRIEREINIKPAQWISTAADSFHTPRQQSMHWHSRTRI